MIGCKLNVHCPLTDVMNGTVCTVVGTCPTVGTHIGLLMQFETTVGVEMVFVTVVIGTVGIVVLTIVLAGIRGKKYGLFYLL